MQEINFLLAMNNTPTQLAQYALWYNQTLGYMSYYDAPNHMCIHYEPKFHLGHPGNHVQCNSGLIETMKNCLSICNFSRKLSKWSREAFGLNMVASQKELIFWHQIWYCQDGWLPPPSYSIGGCLECLLCGATLENMVRPLQNSLKKWTIHRLSSLSTCLDGYYSLWNDQTLDTLKALIWSVVARIRIVLIVSL
jgi:hypothetical protein